MFSSQRSNGLLYWFFLKKHSYRTQWIQAQLSNVQSIQIYYSEAKIKALVPATALVYSTKLCTVCVYNDRPSKESWCWAAWTDELKINNQSLSLREWGSQRHREGVAGRKQTEVLWVMLDTSPDQTKNVRNNLKKRAEGRNAWQMELRHTWCSQLLHIPNLWMPRVQKLVVKRKQTYYIWNHKNLSMMFKWDDMFW